MYALNKLAIVPASGGAPRVVTAQLDRPVSGEISWTSDGRSLLFTVADDRVSYVARMAVAGGSVEKLTSGQQVVTSVSRRDDGAMALLVAKTTSADEVYALENGTLRLGGEKDFNVPILGGEQMYQALRSQRVDTRLVIYPGQFHTITTPSYVRDRLERYVAWFNKYLRGPQT